MGLLLLFIDGIGIGPAHNNPLAHPDNSVLSFTRENHTTYDAFKGSLKAIDACLGLKGLPQSATGQTSIFTGVNAARAISRHLSGFPSPRLRVLLQGDTLFSRARNAGLKTVFANAFTPAYFLLPVNRMSATTLHMLYSGLKPRWVWQVAHGEALFQDFTNRLLIESGMDLDEISPEKAGKILAGMAQQYDLTVYEYFLTDAAGHGRIDESPQNIIRKLDTLLTSLLETLNLRRHTVVICSDHGNVEDGDNAHHTRNPVPLMSWGSGNDRILLGVEDISHIKASICRFLGI